ncbi:hypothetical protein CDAR_514371 [Caerostris darwini]|uniref:Uncharacterized protein n=1 Tax=Caerostris darwini TaxID=1538125 RepID=A0AAV4UN97_9ARAC|nr:hypothetical protein CDAR_514371 [Caerostris darwini]
MLQESMLCARRVDNITKRRGKTPFDGASSLEWEEDLGVSEDELLLTLNYACNIHLEQEHVTSLLRCETQSFLLKKMFATSFRNNEL